MFILQERDKLIYILSLNYVPGFHIQSSEQNHWILSKSGHLLKKDIFNGILFAVPVNHTQSRIGFGVSLFHSRAGSLQYADSIQSNNLDTISFPSLFNSK